MRIALYFNLPLGGAKRAILEIVKRLVEQNEVDVYTSAYQDHDFFDLRPFVSKYHIYPFYPSKLTRPPFGRLNQMKRTFDLFRIMGLHRRMAKVIDSRDYDLVFAHPCQITQSPCLLQFSTVPSVYYCQEPPRLIYEPTVDRPYLTLSRWQRFGNIVDFLPSVYGRSLGSIDEKNLRGSARVLVNSHYSRESVYRIYGRDACVARLGVDPVAFRAMGLPKDDYVISVGALTARKGFDFLIRSLALIDKNLRPTLLLVSNYINEQEHDFLERLAVSLNVKMVIRSRIGDRELVRLYNQALLTLYSPVMEPFGFVPLESMACGTAVVGVREAGVRETVVHEFSGLLTDRRESEFAGEVERLLVDRQCREQLERNGRRYIEEQWSWADSASYIENVLSSVI